MAHPIPICTIRQWRMAGGRGNGKWRGTGGTLPLRVRRFFEQRIDPELFRSIPADLMFRFNFVP